ncbi:MAG: hypothetical protein ACXWZS_15515 [Gemmatirosa sp.]
MRTTRRSPRRPALAITVTALVALAACDDSSSIEGVLAPSAISSGAVGGASSGGLSSGAVGQVPLLGSWTRVAGGGSVLTEQTWTFASGGIGTRTTTTRTALGIVLVVEQQPFVWDAGAGVLLLRFQRDGATEALVRASYAVRIDLTGTVLRLDGLDYVRTGS